MSEYLHIRHGNESRYDELMDLLDTSFDFKKDNFSFLRLLPKLYKKEYKPCENNIVLDVNGELRAAVGVYYSDYTVGEEKLKFCGIGNVACHPEYRNNGYMRFCMAVCLDEMKQNMTDIAFLSGARQRYARYSFEPGGLKYEFIINSYNIKSRLGKNRECKYIARELTEKDTEQIKAITSIYNAGKYHAERSEAAMLDILRNWCAKPYVMLDGDEVKGWFIFNGEMCDISEIGYNEPKDIEEIILAAVNMSKNGEVKICTSVFDKPLCDFLALDCSYYNEGHSDFFSIMNYENVIKAYLKFKASYTTLADGEFTMLIEGEKLPEQLKISVKNNIVTVEETTDKPDIVLKHLEAMRLLCSMHSEKRNELKPECASWFPLPIYVASADSV